jgi:hypothetical protein
MKPGLKRLQSILLGTKVIPTKTGTSTNIISNMNHLNNVLDIDNDNGDLIEVNIEDEDDEFFNYSLANDLSKESNSS